MLKRQRPATPPPPSFGGSPSFLPDGPIRTLQPLYTVDQSHPRSKRQRTQPPPLDGVLRGLAVSEFPGSRWESDGEEDWIEDSPTTSGSPLATSQYKDANSLLYELHVLNQHRLLFAHPPRDRPLNSSIREPLPTMHTHLQESAVGRRPAQWFNGSPYYPALPQFSRSGLTGRSFSIGPVGEKGLVEEVRCVRQRYEGANRLLGSLFLSRRREVEGSISSDGPSLSR